jgi:hypothetical protein
MIIKNNKQDFVNDIWDTILTRIELRITLCRIEPQGEATLIIIGQGGGCSQV